VKVLAGAGFAVTSVGVVLDALLPLYLSTTKGLSASEWSAAYSNRSLGTALGMLLLPIIVEAYGAKSCVVGCSVLTAFLLPLTICLPSLLFISLPVCAAIMSTVLVGQNLLCQRSSEDHEETILMNTYYRMSGATARVIIPLVATQLAAAIGEVAWIGMFGVVAVIAAASAWATALYIPAPTPDVAAKKQPSLPWHVTVVSTLRQQLRMMQHPEVGQAVLTQLLQCVHFGVQKQYQVFYLQEMGQSTQTVGLLLSLSSCFGLASIYLFKGVVAQYGPKGSLRLVYIGQTVLMLAVCSTSSPLLAMLFLGAHQMLDSATPTPNSIWVAEAVKRTGIAGTGDPSTLIASAYAFQKLAVYLSLFFTMPLAAAAAENRAAGGTVLVFGAAAAMCCCAVISASVELTSVRIVGERNKAE
jgi:MFS family permease